MPTEKIWHEYITEANAETDPDKLRKIVIDVARQLNETEDQLLHLDARMRSEEARDEKAARELRAAHAIRQVVAAKAIRELARLLPTAIRQARKEKPALLRLILRATK